MRALAHAYKSLGRVVPNVRERLSHWFSLHRVRRVCVHARVVFLLLCPSPDEPRVTNGHMAAVLVIVKRVLSKWMSICTYLHIIYYSTSNICTFERAIPHNDSRVLVLKSISFHPHSPKIPGKNEPVHPLPRSSFSPYKSNNRLGWCTPASCAWCVMRSTCDKWLAIRNWRAGVFCAPKF